MTPTNVEKTSTSPGAAAGASPAAVLIIDDHELFSTAMVATLLRSGQVARVECATTGEQGLEWARAAHFDLVLCDLGLPNTSGLEVLKALRAAHPGLRVCVLSANTHRQPMVDAVEAGACGYLSKSMGVDEFVEKVLLAMEGQQVYDTGTAGEIIAALRGEGDPLLSERESQLLTFLALGLNTAEMAATLHISANTVKTHLKHLYTKLSAADRADAVAIGFRTGRLS